jgi:predicted transcriptional regulator
MSKQNKHDEKLKLLNKLNVPEREGRILIVLDHNIGGLKQKDLCMDAYMYQPEMSIGLKAMKAKGWVTIVRRIPSEGRGRPHAIYALKKSIGTIINEIEEGITGEYELMIMDIEKLKQIVGTEDLYTSKTKKV